jgi:hypothetical protein
MTLIHEPTSQEESHPERSQTGGRARIRAGRRSSLINLTGSGTDSIEYSVRLGLSRGQKRVVSQTAAHTVGSLQ